MPVINGMKMACEPCIRGHRSTKCTHANERLMVPVKKPGRPLSVCPHIHNQVCGCSSVTAAIPRKQKCHCGTSTVAQSVGQLTTVKSMVADLPSPTKASFRVQKPFASMKTHSRKQSYDPSNFGRIDKAHVNVVPFQPTPAQPMLAPALQNGNTSSITQLYHTNGFQDAEFPNLSFQPQHGELPYQPTNVNTSFSNVTYDLPSPNDSLLKYDNVDGGFGGTDSSSTPASCCASISEVISGAPSIDVFREAEKDSIDYCCASKEITTGSTEVPPYSFSNIGDINQVLYNYYDPHTTVFAYPPSYGSYQNPLQPSEWRKSIMSNLYGQPALGSQISDSATSTSSPNIIASLDTLHTCHCGPGCQCIGCAAHPYNDATQNYVRSAYRITHEGSSAAIIDLTNSKENGNNVIFSSATDTGFEQNNGNGSHQSNGGDFSPPLTESPSENGTGDEQDLSASDFFFVNYPFSNEGCGGDTTSCPCGDECECIGCTIHRFNDPISSPLLEPPLSGDTLTQTDDEGGQHFNGTTIKHEGLSPTNNAQAVKSCCG